MKILPLKEFYININGKEIVMPRNSKELEEYKNICFRIWGACPFDVSWATQTDIYNNAKINNQNDAR